MSSIFRPVPSDFSAYMVDPHELPRLLKGSREPDPDDVEDLSLHALQVRLAAPGAPLLGWLRNHRADGIQGNELVLASAATDPVEPSDRPLEVAVDCVRVPIDRMVKMVDKLTLERAGDLPGLMAKLGIPHYAKVDEFPESFKYRFSWKIAAVEVETYERLFDLEEFVPA